MAAPPFAEKYGSLSAVGVAKEATFGTAAAATDFLPMSGCTLELDPGLFYPEVMQGQRDLNIYGVYGQYKVAGAVDGPLFPTNGIPFLVAGVGTDTITGTGPYVHTIAQAVSLPSLTVEKNVGSSQSQQYTGCRVNKLSLKCEASDTEVTMSADLIGQGEATLTTPTAITVTNEEPFVFAEASVSYNGSAIAIVNSLSLDIENGLKSTYTLNGSHNLEFLTPLTLKVTGTMDVVFDSFNDATYGYYDSFMLAHLPAAFSVTFTHPSNGGSVEISLPAIRLSKIAIAPKMSDVVMETLSFEAEFSKTSGYTVQAIVTNSVATAY